MTMRGFESVGVRAVILGLPEYLAGAKSITSANVGISGSLKGVEGISSGFKLLGAAVASASAVIAGVAVVSAAKYESTLAKISALTNTSAEDTAKLSKGLLQLAQTVPKTPDELGAAAYFALSSGISDVDDALALVTVASKASAAGLGSTADIVDIVTAAINAYGKENLTAADATDILVAAVREGKGEPAEMATALGSLLPLAAALNISFEEVAAVFASLTNTLGGSGGAVQAATQFKGILSQILSPSKEAKDALAEQEAGVKHLSQEELDLAEAHKSVASATDSYNSAQRSLRNATEDAARAQRDQTQAVFDARKELLSVAEAEQRLSSLRVRGPAQALEEQRAVQALAQARKNLNDETAKGAKGDTGRARLDLAEAEQRLREVRANAPQQALDIKQAELGLAEARSRVGETAKNQAKRERDAAEGVQEAQRGVARSSEELALAQEKQNLAQIHGRDAFAALRKEIAEKGFRESLQRIVDLFADNESGLAKLFPDIRGLIGVLSAFDSQSEQTKTILDRVRDHAGLTQKAFDDMSKTTKFQADLLKTQFNVGLIQLGNVALPAVNAVLGEALRLFGPFKDSLSSVGEAIPGILGGINSALSETFGQLAGGGFQTDFFGAIVKSLKDAGKSVAEFFRLFKVGLAGGDIGGEFAAIQQAAFDFGAFVRDTLIPAFNDAKEAVRLFFVALAGGEVGGNISDLQNSFYELGATVRQQWFDVIRPAIEEGAAAIKTAWENDIQPALVAFADIAYKTGQGVVEAVKFIIDNWNSIKPVFAGVVESVRSAIAIFGEMLKIVTEVVQGVDAVIHGQWSEAWGHAKEVVSTAFDIVKEIIKKSPNVIGQLFIDLGTEVAKAALQAGISIGKALGNGIIDAINDAIESLGGRVIIPAISVAGHDVSPEVKLPKLGRPIPRLARGDVVSEPTIALFGEAGPEAILPLSDPRRSREILGSLPPPLIKNLFPVQAFAEGGIFGRSSGGGNDAGVRAPLGGGSTGGGFSIFGRSSGGGSDAGVRAPLGGGSTGGGFSTDLATSYAAQERRVYATLTPSMRQSMGGGAIRQPNAPISFDSLFGDVTIGSTSREVEEIAVSTVRGLFARARGQTAVGGGVMSSGFG